MNSLLRHFMIKVLHEFLLAMVPGNNVGARIYVLHLQGSTSGGKNVGFLETMDLLANGALLLHSPQEAFSTMLKL